MARPNDLRARVLRGARWMGLLLVACTPLLLARAEGPTRTIRSELRLSPASGSASRARAHLQLVEAGERDVTLSLELWLERPSGFVMERAVLQPRRAPREAPAAVILLSDHALLDRGVLYASGSVRLPHAEAQRLVATPQAFELVVTSLNATQGELRGSLER